MIGSAESRRRLTALAQAIPAEAKRPPIGGMARAERIFAATPADWSDVARVEHTKSVLRLTSGGDWLREATA